MTLADLVARVPPPAQVVAERTWDEVTRVVGVSFAAGYREVLEAYGKGRFEQGTTLFDPRRREFDEQVRELGEIMADPQLHAEPPPHPPHPGGGARLLAVTANGSGGYVMAVVVDGVQDESEYWLADLDVDEFERVDGPFADLLLGLARPSPAEVTDAWQFAAPSNRCDPSRGRS